VKELEPHLLRLYQFEATGAPTPPKLAMQAKAHLIPKADHRIRIRIWPEIQVG
jgi:hypothetical protein